jgi:hypothetical protein
VADEQTQWFRGTSGLVWGIVALVMAAAVMALDIAAGLDVPVVIGSLLFAALAYAALIRPRIGVGSDELILDHMFSTVRIPVAAVRSIAIGRTFEARTVDGAYVSAAVGRSLRQALKGRVIRDTQLRRGEPLPPPPHTKPTEMSYADFVVERIHGLAVAARERAHIEDASPEQERLSEQVRRTWAWPEIVAVVVLAAAFVVSLFG